LKDILEAMEAIEGFVKGNFKSDSKASIAVNKEF